MSPILTPQALARLRYEGSATRCHFGGDSNSSQETKNFDQRVVGGDGSQNLSINAGGDAVISMTDHGAVSASMDLAKRGIEAVQQTSLATVNTNADILAGVLKHTGAQQSAFTDTLKSLETKDTTILVIAGLTVVGLAAATLLKNFRG